MKNIICRFLLVTILTMSMQAVPATPARADILDDLANLIDDVEQYGGVSWLPASGDDIRESKEFIVNLSNAGNDVEVLKCIEDFKDTKLGSKIGDEIPSWVYDLITVYIALKEKDYTTLIVYLGKAAACAILQVISGGALDVCGLIEDLIAIANTLLDAATAVYEFFKDVGEAAWEGVKAVGCALGIGGCDDGSSPPEVIAYAWVFAPRVLPQGLAAIKAVDASAFPSLRKKLEENARAKPPVTDDPALNNWLKQSGYTIPASAVDIASKTFQNTVEAQWKADLANNVLPVLSKARADYGTPSKISALAGPALAGSSSDGQKFRSLVSDQCASDMNISMEFAHVDRWVSSHSLEAVQLGNLKPNKVWCAGDFWSPAVKSEFANHLRNHVKNSICPAGSQGFSCPSTDKYDACRRLLKAVDIEGECSVDVAKVGKEVAQKIVTELKAKGSTWNYEIRESPSQTAKPADIVCVRPTQQQACVSIYDAKFGHIAPKVVNCGLEMTQAYKILMSATAAETDRLGKQYMEPFVVDNRDPLFVHAPSMPTMTTVQEDPQQHFKFDFYALKVPRSVDGLNNPSMGVEVDLKEPVGQMGRDQIEDKVRGFHAGGPDQLRDNLLESVTSPVDRLGGVEQTVRPDVIAGAKVSERISTAPAGQIAATPQTQLKAPLAGQPAAPMQTMSTQMPPGSAPTSPPPQTSRQIQTNALQAQPQVAQKLPDITTEPALTIGGKRASWGQAVTMTASDAQRSANGVCYFPVNYAVRNAGSPVAGSFYSTLAGSQVPAPTGRTWPPMGQNAVVSQTDSVALKPGQNVLTLTMDQRNQVKESNENNNVFRLTVTLSGECGTARTLPPTQIQRPPQAKPLSGTAPKPQLPIRAPQPTQ